MGRVEGKHKNSKLFAWKLCKSKLNMRVLVVVLILTLGSSFMLTACSNSVDLKEPLNSDGQNKISVVTSFYVMYDFASKIGGDKATVKNLLPAGSDPHSWEPSPKDVISIEKADMFVYNGVDLEGWVDKVLKSITNKELVIIETSKDVSLIIPGDDHENQLAKEGQKAHEGENEHDHDHGHLYDPHVWLDPMNAKIQMESITEAFVKIDASNADYYRENFRTYSQEFDNLDKEYKDAISATKKKDIVVSHEAFGYLCSAYGLNQVGISGLDAEAEPTASRMVEVADFAKANNVRVVFFDQMVNPKTAKAIANATGAKVDVLNPISSLSDKEIQEGKDYFSVMRENLEALERSLRD